MLATDIFEEKAMKRHPALQRLSKEHHLGLIYAYRLMNTSRLEAFMGATVLTLPQAAADYLEFWPQLRRHNLLEEEVLVSEYRLVSPVLPPEWEKMLAEHRRLYELSELLKQQLETNILQTAILFDLGELLEAHIRLEERVIFPMLEANLPPEILLGLQAKLI